MRGPDARALAVFRAAVGAVLFLSLGTQLLEMESLYSDLGAVSRADAYRLAPGVAFIVHDASGWWAASLLILMAQLVAAAALLVGVHSRAVSLASWLLLLSMHFRNPAVELPGDGYLRLYLLWGALLPWGCRWARRADAPISGASPMVAQAGLFLCWIEAAASSLRLTGALPHVAYLPLLALLPGVVWKAAPLARLGEGLDRALPVAAEEPASRARSLAPVFLTALLAIPLAFPVLGKGSLPQWANALGLPQPLARGEVLRPVGELPDGSRFELPADGRDWALPCHPRWAALRQYMPRAPQGMAVIYGRYLAYRWNEDHPDRRLSGVLLLKEGERLEGKPFAVYRVPAAAPEKPGPPVI